MIPGLPQRYTLGEWLGEGTQGTVWAAQDEVSGAEVAVKAFRPGAPGRLWRREVAALLALELPGVVRILDLGRGGAGVEWVVMERVGGAAFPGMGRRSWKEVEPAVVDLLRVLRRVHTHGVVHRDLKPENVRVQAGRVTLLDFGGAVGEGADVGGERDAHGVGTERWAPPEWDEAPEGVDPRRDLWSVGVMLYEALLGRAPFADPAARHREAGIGPLGRLVPGTVARLLEALLRRDPAERPASAEAALGLLGVPAEAPPGERWARRVEAARAEDRLHTLFAGPERLFARRSRARATLERRLDAWPEEAPAELAAWVEAGLAHVEGEALRVPDPELDRLDNLVPLRLPARGPPLPPVDAARVWLVHLGWPAATDQDLGGPLPVIEAAGGLGAFEALVDGGWLTRRAPGRWRARRLPEGELDLAPLRRAWLQRLPAGDPRRLAHLVALGESPLPEGLAVAEARLRDGDAAGAARVYGALVVWVRGALPPRAEEVLPRLTLGDPPTDEGALLEGLVAAALSEHGTAGLRRARWELLRSDGADLVVGPLSELVDAALAAREARGGGALPVATPRFRAEALDRWRIAVAVEAAQHAGAAALDAALERAATWARAWGSRTAEADLAGWRGLRAYHAGRFEEAAAELQVAANHKWGRSGRLSSLGSRAAALLELGRHVEVERLAQAALVEAWAACGARAPIPGAMLTFEWARRAARYRRGEADPPDEELVEAALVLGADTRVGQVLLQEAAAARRVGAWTRAAELARRAAAVWAGRGGAALILAEALALTCAAEAGEEPVIGGPRGGATAGTGAATTVAAAEALAARAGEALRGPLPGVALQGLMLLFGPWPSLRARWEDPARAAWAGLPPALRRGVREVLDPHPILAGTVGRATP